MAFDISSYENKLNLSKNALTVLATRYLRKNPAGEVTETPEELFWRVAYHIASADAFREGVEKATDISKLYPAIESNPELKNKIQATAEKFYGMLSSLEFLPNSPTLMNAGTGAGTLSACFVLPIDDTMESIMESSTFSALIQTFGGGVGFCFSRLRPKGSLVRTTHGRACGPVNVMRHYSSVTDMVTQGGKRHGANMGTMLVSHPDIQEFIRCKAQEGAISNFNISVAVTDEFMKSVEQDADFTLRDPRNQEPVKQIRAKELFNEIVQSAWSNGEPGMIFIDEINRKNPVIGTSIEATNPCGEQPLLPYESCNLGSINLSKFVKDGEVDWEHLKEVVWLAVHFLDNVIDINAYPLKRIEEITLRNRKIGLGIMGFADLLILLEIPYGSNESLSLAQRLMEFVSYHSRLASIELAKLRGSFPAFESSIYADETKLKETFKYSKSKLDWKLLIEQIKKSGVRTSTTTTIAPTGTIGIIANASGGIEPLFAVAYRREGVLATAGSQAKTLFEVNPVFEKVAREKEFYSAELMEKISRKLSIQEVEDIPKDIREIFVTAHDISPESHIKIQSAFQRFVDNAVSKTINFPNSAMQEDIERAFLSAWKSGCKGITVYRDGSRKLQVLTTRQKEKEQEIKPVPDVLFGLTLKIKTGCGNSFILLSLDGKGIPRRIFNNMGKAGLCPGAHTQALCRIMSHYFAKGGDVDTAIEQLDGIACHRPFGIGPAKVLSCADAVAKALKWYRQFKKADETYDFPKAVALISENPELKWWEVGEEQKSASLDAFLFPDEAGKSKGQQSLGNGYGACRVCGGQVVEQEGCRKCMACGAGDCF